MEQEVPTAELIPLEASCRGDMEMLLSFFEESFRANIANVLENQPYDPTPGKLEAKRPSDVTNEDIWQAFPPIFENITPQNAANVAALIHSVLSSLETPEFNILKGYIDRLFEQLIKSQSTEDLEVLRVMVSVFKELGVSIGHEGIRLQAIGQLRPTG